MENTKADYKAHCACGGVEVEISGAPVHAATGWPKAQVNITRDADNVTIYRRSDASHRKSCKSCGGAAFVEHPDISVYDVLASSIDGFRFTPAMQIYYDERLIDMKDGLPKFRKAPTALGGDDGLMKE